MDDESIQRRCLSAIRLELGRERVALCEPVAPPKGIQQYQQYFCASELGNADQLRENEPKRVELYRAVAALVRAHGNLANDMAVAGFTDAEAAAIKAEVAHYASVRDEVKLGAGENIDYKQYEAGMRTLLDTYIQADASETVSNFEDTSLIDLIVKLGAGAVDKLPAGIRKEPEAVAETIVNNMRKVIIDERATNPKYYDKMSELLDALIEQRRKEAIDYKAFLAQLLEQASQLGKGEGGGTTYPTWADNGARKALCDFFVDPAMAIQVDTAVLTSKPHDWIGNPLKEKVVKRAIKRVLPADFDQLDELFDLVKARNEYE